MLTPDEAAALAEGHRAAGRRVVLIGGVFDLLYPGHIRMLAGARSQGDVLIVAIQSDPVVRDRLGPSRPLTTAAERAEILEALTMVDAVVISDRASLQAIIEKIRPDVLAPGEQQ
jgi:rfaE bifunctional protein nucleotidyltransferase chain/domain